MRRGYVHRALLWGQLGGDANRVAMQLSERRLHRSVPRQLSETPLLNGQLAIGWNVVSPHFAEAWRKHGGTCEEVTHPWAKWYRPDLSSAKNMDEPLSKQQHCAAL